MNQTHLTPNERNESTHDLAVDRTVFAYERTALAYVRTSLTFVIAGVSLFKFFEEVPIKAVGAMLIPFALYFMYLGIQKFSELQSFLESHKKS